MTERAFDVALLLSRIEGFSSARQGVVGIVDAMQDAIEAVRLDPYLTGEERQLAVQRARDEAAARIDETVQLARGRSDALQEALDGLLSQREPTPDARVRIRRLLDQGVAIGTLIDRAQEQRDVDLLDAAREELKYLAVPDRRGHPRWVEAPRLVTKLNLAVADLTPGAEGTVLRQAIDLSESPGLKEAHKFVLRAVAGDESMNQARLAYAYAVGPDPRSGGAQGGDGGDGGDGEQGGGAGE